MDLYLFHFSIINVSHSNLVAILPSLSHILAIVDSGNIAFMFNQPSRYLDAYLLAHCVWLGSCYHCSCILFLHILIILQMLPFRLSSLASRVSSWSNLRPSNLMISSLLGLLDTRAISPARHCSILPKHEAYND